jgi:HAD superfamily hydrolase (TIGR01662 family)
LIRGVIFDLGSTLIRYDAEWREVMAESHAVLTDYLIACGLELDREAFASAFEKEVIDNYQARMHHWVERTAGSLLRDVLALFGQNAIDDEIIDEGLKRMYAVSEARWHPMPDVYDVLEAFQEQGKRLGMISNASDEGNVQRLIDQAGLREYFDPILISAAEGMRKPDESLFEKVLQTWGIEPDQVVMIGDLLGADILGAQRAGMHQIWLTAEADSPSNDVFREAVQPEAKAERLTDVLEIVRDMDAVAGDE